MQKSQIWVEAISLPEQKIDNSSQKTRKSRYQSFVVLSNFTRCPYYFVPNNSMMYHHSWKRIAITKIKNDFYFPFSYSTLKGFNIRCFSYFLLWTSHYFSESLYIELFEIIFYLWMGSECTYYFLFHKLVSAVNFTWKWISLLFHSEVTLEYLTGVCHTSKWYWLVTKEFWYEYLAGVCKTSNWYE